MDYEDEVNRLRATTTPGARGSDTPKRLAALTMDPAWGACGVKVLPNSRGLQHTNEVPRLPRIMLCRIGAGLLVPARP